MFLLRAGMYAVVSVTAAVLPFAPEVSVSFNRSGFDGPRRLQQD